MRIVQLKVKEKRPPEMKQNGFVNLGKKSLNRQSAQNAKEKLEQFLEILKLAGNTENLQKLGKSWDKISHGIFVFNCFQFFPGCLDWNDE